MDSGLATEARRHQALPKLRAIGIVGETTLTLLILILIGLIVLDIVIQVACCLYRRGSTQTTIAQGLASITITGSGSTFIYPQMKEWISRFQSENPTISVIYNPTGSGTGQSQLLKEHVVDFACSDPPLSHEQYEEYKGKVLQMPVIVGAIAITYKIPGYQGPLNLTANVIAKIYLGKIKYWDDPEIARLNPRAKLPHVVIKVIHRSDASGTTEVFTFFLHKAAPSMWPANLVGKAIEWPIDSTGRGLGAKGNQGVAEYFKRLDSAIAYVELGYALENKFPIAAIRNADGVFIKPSPETMQAAIANALRSGLLPSSPLDDWSNALNAIIYASGKDSYPIVSFSFMIAWTKYPRAKAEALKKFIKFVNTIGQEDVIEGYAPIPPELRTINLKALSIIQGS